MEPELKMICQRMHDDATAPRPITEEVFASWPHQVAAHNFLSKSKAAILHMGMGTGKTKIVIDLIRMEGIQTVLIACPKSVCAVWKKQLAIHWPNFPGKVLVLDKGSVAQRAAKLREALGWHGGGATQAPIGVVRPLIVICNYDSLWRQPIGQLALSVGWPLVVADECHRIKAAGSKVSWFFKALGQRAFRRLGLTGTPMPNNPLDVYGQFRFLAPHVFGVSFARFKDRYAILGGPNRQFLVGFRNTDEIASKMRPWTFHVDRSILDLPEEVECERPFSLDRVELSAYRSLEKNLIAQIRGKTITIQNALVELAKLRQITSGFLMDQGSSERLGDSRKRALSDLLEDLDPKEPVVVFANLTLEIDDIREVLASSGREVAELSGRSDDVGGKWEGTATGLAVQIRAGSLGVDLTKACHAVFYSPQFSLGDYQQAKARIHRPGQNRKCTHIHLIADGTVDEDIVGALRRKEKIVDALVKKIGRE